MTTDTDQHLADFTDNLLAHPQAALPETLSHEEQLVRRLRDLMPPGREVSPVFRQRLTRRLNEEWAAAHPVRSKRRSARLLSTRLYALAAAVVVALLGIALVLGSGGEGQTGTATGEGNVGVIVVVIFAGGVVLSGLAYWWMQRRR